MKIRAETLLSTKKDIQYNKILVTGSDESFIGYVKNYFINRFKKLEINQSKMTVGI